MRAWAARSVALAAACAMLAAAAGAFQLKDEVGRFSARFPAEPTLDKVQGTSDLGSHVHYTWEVDVDDRHWSVTYTEYSRPPVKNYDKNVMNLRSATKGTIAWQARIEQSGFDGREVAMLLPAGTVMRVRMFMVGNRFYQAVYGGPAGSETNADAETFLTSFELLK
jgi:hypothetical protein